MKSSPKDLKSRGYLPENEENRYLLSYEEKINLLSSKIPIERTLAARLLSDNKSADTISILIDTLRKEKKLYPKIEICNTLIKYGKDSVKPLINVLGEIGNNQHVVVPAEKFRKVSYPLPRDIAARTLAYIGTDALPELLSALEISDIKKLSEVIDSIGYICFYNYQENIAEKLLTCYHKHSNNELITWKIIRALSAFPESTSFLREQQKLISNPGIQNEIERSIRLIGQRNHIH